jgi:hypothetical protein
MLKCNVYPTNPTGKFYCRFVTDTNNKSQGGREAKKITSCHESFEKDRLLRRGFFAVLLNPSRGMPEYLKMGHDRFFPNPILLFAYKHFIWRCVLCVTENLS